MPGARECGAHMTTQFALARQLRHATRTVCILWSLFKSLDWICRELLQEIDSYSGDDPLPLWVRCAISAPLFRSSGID